MTRLDEIKEKIASGDYYEEDWRINEATADIAWLLGKVERLTRERDEFRALAASIAERVEDPKLTQAEADELADKLRNAANEVE